MGGWVISLNPGFLLVWLVGGLLLVIGVLLSPRPRRLGGNAEVVERGSAPELYGVAERVAGAVGVRPPVAVAVEDLAIGAEYPLVGWRRRPVLVVGLPLWLVLSARQRVVLLAKAYTEERGDDLLVGGALWTLAQWRESLMSGRPLARRGETHIYMATVLGAAAPRGSYDAAGTLGQVFGKMLGWPVLLVERALLRLTRADDGPARRDPARLRGVVTEAEVARLEELVAARRFMAPLQAAVLRGATVPEIRRSVPAGVTGSGVDGEGGATRLEGERLFTVGASEAVDVELARHYSRAVRAFGLVW
ncbi:hypothetical protein [Sphaerisporangium sp. TRM90804]|uniref:hypothetical protein n=1 Tax=Sphaerisporangium sp. TRM90804 TaxID=3031113 RepID=UPI00244D55A7|nr:hypothetical protein [Sphaerisporangium sp. TRM90804]MDH2427969.1 hypothetical protein [Sphaerisporangium sp. TRM90804]